jgi:Ca2+-binding RTX toxin-like protein
MSGGGDDVIRDGGSPETIDLTDLRIVENVVARVAIVGAEAGYRNSVGTYEIAADGTISDVRILFADASAKGAGAVDVALRSGDRIGFFIVADGYRAAEHNPALLAAEGPFLFVDAAGLPAKIGGPAPFRLFHVDSSTGVVAEIESRKGADIFHSAADPDDGYALNGDGTLHVVGRTDVATGELVLNFEDLRGGGDRDYDDAVLSIRLGEANVAALSPAIGTGPGSPDDTLSGGAGDDRIEGNRGADLLSGDSGDDALSGGDGADELKGGTGDDTLRGGKDDDRLDGGEGDDGIFGDSGDDTLIGGGGDDVYDGGSGWDVLDFARSGRAVSVDLHAHLVVGFGDDAVRGIEEVKGSGFADDFKGDKRANRLDGGGGDDRFRGLEGDDTLIGGDGADRFFWLGKDLGDATEPFVDVIVGFDATDVLDFTKLVPNVDRAAVGDWVRLADTTAGTLVRVDLDGGAADFRDVCLLEDLRGLDLADLLADGQLLV